MRVRPYTEADLETLRRMHARQGFDYAFPDLADPIFVSKLVVEDDDCRAVMASLARLTCEMYLLVDRDDDDRSAGILPAVLARMDAAEIRRQDAPRPSSGQGGATNRSVAARQRYEWLLALHRAGEQDLLARGLDDAHAWIPPPIAKRFGRRLEALGWGRDDAWTPYCRRLSSP